MGSPAFSLNVDDLIAIAKGAGIAAAGAALKYLSEAGASFDQATLEGAIKFVVLSTLVNLGRKWWFEQK